MLGSPPRNICFAFLGPAIVIYHGMPHRLFINDFGNVQMVQTGDELIYFSRQPGEKNVFTKKLITFIPLPPFSEDLLVAPFNVMFTSTANSPLWPKTCLQT